MASAVSAVGGSFSLIAVPTQLFTLTGSSAVVGVSAAVGMCALIMSALWSGALADVMDLPLPKSSSVQVTRHAGTRGGCRRGDRVFGC
jgi:hypothetical protein